MKTKLLLAASAAAICVAYSLSAARATQFEGVYIGLHGGVGILDADYIHVQPVFALAEPLSFDDSAPVGGGQIGVRWDINPDWVLGLEATYTAGSIDDTVASVVVNNRSRTFEISDQFTATAQIGYSWHEDWLLYIKGGYANAEVDIRSNRISTGLLTSTSSDRESGWTVGVGIDHKIAPNWTLGLAYDYSNYSPDDRSNVDVNGFTTQHHEDIDASAHLVTARLSYTF